MGATGIEATERVHTQPTIPILVAESWGNESDVTGKPTGRWFPVVVGKRDLSENVNIRQKGSGDRHAKPAGSVTGPKYKGAVEFFVIGGAVLLIVKFYKAATLEVRSAISFTEKWCPFANIGNSFLCVCG